MFVIPFVVFFVIFLVIAMNAFKVHKTVKDVVDNSKSSTEEKPNETIIFVPTQTVTDEKRICEYCGSENDADNKKCKSCGATIKRK